MSIYAEPVRSASLWRATSREVSGDGCAPGPFALGPNGERFLVRTYSLPWHSEAMCKSAGVRLDAPATVPGLPKGICHAVIEHPVSRLRDAWSYRLTDPCWAAQNAARFPGLSPHNYGDFLRWILYQDPLAVDCLVRPQWAMIPTHCQMIQGIAHQVEAYSSEAEIVAMCYADDLTLWQGAKVCLEG